MSDYAGEHAESRYEVISILAFDFASAAQWNAMTRSVRQRCLKDHRRMSFKSLGDRRRRKALQPFLCAADSLTGICASFAIHKDVKYLCLDPKDTAKIVSDIGLQGTWNAKGLERLLRVVHFVSVLISGLSHPSQNVYWISDQDNMFANSTRCQDVTRLASLFTRYYVQHPLGELGIGTTQIDESDMALEDMAAIPDLVAGAVAELTTQIAATYGGRIPYGIALSVPNNITWKAQALVDWLASEYQHLKRPIIIFDLIETGQLRVYNFQLA